MDFRKLLFCAGAFALVGCASTPSVDTNAEQSFDGLTPLKNTIASRVWVDPEFDLTGYSKVMLVGSEIQYRPVKGTATARFRSSASEFPLTEDQKDRLEEVFDEEFTKALRELDRYEVVDQRGPDVLLVRGALVDVVSKVPPEGPGRFEYYLESVGEATFIVEIVDSQSDKVLIRAVDRRSAGQDGGPVLEANRVTNTAEVRRLARRWSERLVESLNEGSTFKALVSPEAES